jgi:hypothetical protein
MWNARWAAGVLGCNRGGVVGEGTAQAPPARAKEPTQDEKDAQRTALITGVASIVFGVSFLSFLSLL